jgi:hypothetical protein
MKAFSHDGQNGLINKGFYSLSLHVFIGLKNVFFNYFFTSNYFNVFMLKIIF